jgi:hypothetical protein
MADSHDLIEGYLRELSGRIFRLGRGEKRLLAELRDHLEDSTAAHLTRGLTPADAAVRAIDLTGPAAEIAEDWDTRRRRRRRRQRNRAGALIATVAAATALAAAQHAQGRHTPTRHPCSTAGSTATRSAPCDTPR